MAVSVKISQLLPGGSIQSTDELPISRAGLETFKIAASQIVTTASNVGAGTGQMFLNKLTTGSGNLQFRSLSGADGLAVANSGNTLVISASGQNPVKTSITGNGTTTTFAVNEANSINANNYRVDIDGVLQEPLTDYTISGSNIVFSTPPPAGGKVTVVSNNLVKAYDIIPSDGSVTTNKLALSAVTTDKILNNAVTTDKIVDSSITFAKLAPSSKTLTSNTLTATTQQFINASFTISQPGWLIVSGNCVASYSGSVANAGNYVFISLNGTIIAHDGMFEGESASVTFYSNAVGMSYLAAGDHTLQLQHVVQSASRSSARLSYVVFPI
jgi:hypothetical protein